jgi:hypothetical protein
VNDEMGEDNNYHSNTFPLESTVRNRGYILLGFSFFKIIDNTNFNLLRLNHTDMIGDIAESQHDKEKIDLKFVIGNEDPYDVFAY